MKKKHYQKPLIEKVNLKVTESILTACKLVTPMVQPNSAPRSRACDHHQANCLETVGT